MLGRFWRPALLLLLVALAALQAVRARDEAVLADMDRIRVSGMENVPPQDGDFLRDLILREGYTRGLEIGTSTGYSACRMALALRQTGGTLVTMEIDPGRAAQARENFRRFGVDDVVTLEEGDARDLVLGVQGPLDFVFLDANKEAYGHYLEHLVPKIRPGGALIAHNVESHAREMPDFLQAIRTDRRLRTEWHRTSPAGISVSYVQEGP